MSPSVLDSSAVLAILFSEPGEETPRRAIEGSAAISAVNLAEVAARLSRGGMPGTEVAEAVSALPIEVLDADRQIAIEAGNLYALTRQFGLSFGDRFCIATALRERAAVVTVEKIWKNLSALLGLNIQMIR